MSRRAASRAASAAGGRLPVTVVLEDPRLPYPYQDGGAFNELDRADLRRLKEALGRLGRYRFEFLDRHETLAAELAERRPGFVLNLCDTGWRNRGELEGHVPALLEMLGIPYSGAGPAALAICRDKALVRAVAAGLGVPVPAELYVEGATPADLEGLRYPAIVKPNLEEGSRGITAAAVVDGPRAAAARIEELARRLPGSPLLVQQFLGGAEYSVGLVGNPEIGLEILPVLEVDYEGLDPDLPRILAYEFKTEPASRYATRLGYRRARLEPRQAIELARWSRRLFARLGCRDYARIDFRADDDGRIRLLEVNSNPAWVFEGGLHSMAAVAGDDYPAFLGRLVDAALARHGLAPPGQPPAADG